MPGMRRRIQLADMVCLQRAHGAGVALREATVGNLVESGAPRLQGDEAAPSEPPGLELVAGAGLEVEGGLDALRRGVALEVGDDPARGGVVVGEEALVPVVLEGDVEDAVRHRVRDALEGGAVALRVKVLLEG